MQRFWKEYFIYSMDNLVIPLGAGLTFTDTNVKIDTDSNFFIVKRSHIVTNNNILVKFRDDTEGRYYQSVPLDLLSISTDHTPIAPTIDFQPYILNAPILLKAATTYTAEFSDYSGVANTIRLALHGTKVRPGKPPWDHNFRRRLPFDYNIEVVLGAGQTLINNIPINIDADFIVKKISGTRTGNALISVKDTSTDKNWMNTPIHINNFMGGGRYPNNLPAPRFVKRGTGISLQLQDLSGAANTIRISFSGEKLFV